MPIMFLNFGAASGYPGCVMSNKILIIMKVRLLVTVYLDSKCFSQQKQIFARVVERDSSSIDCMEIYKSCRVLFGDSCIVDFKLQDYAAI